MNYAQRLVYNKLISGAFRIGISQLLVMRALSQLSGVETDIIAQRMMGEWEPSAEFFEKVTNGTLDEDEAPIARPYPFHLAHQADFPLEDLGDVADWQAEWKWDGIRAQVIKRAGQVFIWSRGEDLMTERFPEIAQAAQSLPDGTVLDGEVLPWDEIEGVMPFTVLQRRIGRKNLSPKILAEIPIILQCYDILESEARDIRAEPIKKRRKILEKTIGKLDAEAKKVFRPTDIVTAGSWEELAAIREDSRARRVEGFMLKAAFITLPDGPPSRRLVEMEDRSVHY